jgi:uncharacterized membrane protein YgdD (TMEM256/DUF423 family)
MRALLVVAAFYGLTAVVLGAFGAHALKAKLSADQLVSYETGVRYQLIHALLILVIALWSRQSPSALLGWAGTLLAIGIALFSFSIYLLATRDVIGLTSWKWLGPVTPFGGLLLISGWVLILVWALRQNNP